MDGILLVVTELAPSLIRVPAVCTESTCQVQGHTDTAVPGEKKVEDEWENLTC